MEGITNSQKKLLCQFIEMMNCITFKGDATAEKILPKMGDSTSSYLKQSKRNAHYDHAQHSHSLKDFLPKTMKLDFPRYDGKEDPTSWICQWE